MFEDLETLMLQEGWEKLSRNNIGSFTTSRGYTYTGLATAVPGKYPDTIGIRLTPGVSFKHTGFPTTTTPSSAYYADYPTDFSISFWVQLGDGAEGAYNTSYNLLAPFVRADSLQKGATISLDWLGAVRFEDAVGDSLAWAVENYFINKKGDSYEFFTFTYEKNTKQVKIFINGVLLIEGTYLESYTLYPFYYSLQACGTYTIDELIVWNKALSLEEINVLFTRTSKVLSTEPFVFEKYTENLGILAGGYFRKTSLLGTPIIISITHTQQNNVELKTCGFFAGTLISSLDYQVANTSIGSPSYFMAGVSPKSTELKKYWLVVKDDYVAIAYKIYNPAALRETPLYQLGYIGKINSLGNDGNAVYIAGTATSSSVLWTTRNSTSFRSGVYYSPNGCYKLGHTGFINCSVGSINSTLSGLTSISNSSFLAGINISYSTHAIGSFFGVYVVSNLQGMPEDIITINSVDYVVLDDADSGTNAYRLALRLL